MAIVTRYFSTSSAGAADGTSWANRAALFSSGNWSSVITGFDWTSNSLIAYIGPGTYTCSQTLQTSITTVSDPSLANPLFLIACDSSGNPWAPANPAWSADKGDMDTTGMPVIATTTNVASVAMAGTFLHGIKFTATGRTSGAIVSSVNAVDWCYFESSSANASAGGLIGGGYGTNLCVVMTGTQYSYGISAYYFLSNVRVRGNPSASAGVGLIYASNFLACYFDGVVSFNHKSHGLEVTNSGTSIYFRANRCIFANNGGSGVHLYNATAGQYTGFTRCMFTGNASYGINGGSGYSVLALRSRFRDNPSGNMTNMLNYPTTEWNNYTTDSDDASEYVDAANGDFRIRSDAAIAPMGFGISVARPTVAA